MAEFFFREMVATLPKLDFFTIVFHRNVLKFFRTSIFQSFSGKLVQFGFHSLFSFIQLIMDSDTRKNRKLSVVCIIYVNRSRPILDEEREIT